MRIGSYYSDLYGSYSYFLYSITYPGKNGVPLIDLSADNEAQISDEGFSLHQAAIERIFSNITYM